MAERSVSDSDSFELFVPGRVALLGEHSDWAAGFREHSGYCLVTGTEQGLYARVRRLSDRKALVLRSVDESGVAASTWLDHEDPTALLALAQAGGFWSYAAGVAYQIVVTNEVGGLEVDNYRTTLPLRKGLSSSAALCVLVARAFSKAYKLKYTIRGEMELAYRGEIATPSKCGRMDQCCAFGSTPVFMTFDGDHLFCEPLSLPRGAVFHYVIVDLLAKKDTTEILAALSKLVWHAGPALVSSGAPVQPPPSPPSAQGKLTLFRRQAQRTPPDDSSRKALFDSWDLRTKDSY